MANPKKTLILFAHPAIHKSRVNRAMMDAVKNLENVTFHDLYAAYPDLYIDVEFPLSEPPAKRAKPHDFNVWSTIMLLPTFPILTLSKLCQ
jgi:putative NADPH-quinone reductase